MKSDRGSRLATRRYPGMAIGGALLLLSLLAAPARATAQVSLLTAVDQALRNSAGVRMATADVQRATGSLTETRDVYLPSFVFGSSVGYSYGFPIGQPSIANISSQSLIFNFSQRDYVRSARAGLQSAQLALADARQQVVFDVSLDYVQLETDRRRVEVLDEQNKAAAKLTGIEEQRLDAGVGTREDVLRARLMSAQLRLKRLHIEDEIDLLRQRLAHLTGLPAESLTTIGASIPAAPELGALSSPTAMMSAMNSEGVRAAYATAKSRQYQAFGDARQNFRPQFAFGGDYSRYAEFNNYQNYYKNFQHNNFEVGVQITLPLFDATRRAKERQSRAESIHASAQADQLRDQSSENIVLLEKTLVELGAQKDVAQLQNELAQSQLDAILTQMNASSSSPGSAPVTPREEQQARIEERRRYEEVLDATFEMTRTELNLLRATGGIEQWATTAAKP